MGRYEREEGGGRAKSGTHMVQFGKHGPEQHERHHGVQSSVDHDRRDLERPRSSSHPGSRGQVAADAPANAVSKAGLLPARPAPFFSERSLSLARSVSLSKQARGGKQAGVAKLTFAIRLVGETAGTGE